MRSITFTYVIILTYMIQSGIILFSLPRIVARAFGYNGWLVLPVCGLIAALNIFLISLVPRLAKGRSVPEMLEYCLNRKLVFALYAGLGLFWSILGSLALKSHILMLQMISFPTTYPIILFVLAQLVALYLVVQGFETIWRSSIIYFCIGFPLLLLLAYEIPEFEWARLTTFVFEKGSLDAKGFLDIFTGFLGYEIFLVAYPFVKVNKLFSAVQLGNVLLTVVYTLISFISYGFYSLEHLKIIKYPVLNLLAYVQFPFLVRVDDFFFNVLMVKVLMTSVVYLWISVTLLNRLLSMKISYIASLLAFLSAAYDLVLVPASTEGTSHILSWFGYAEFVLAWTLPVLSLLLIWRFRAKGGMSRVS